MKIAFVTELPFFGKVKKDYDNIRTEFAWMIALDADNVPITQMDGIKDGEYDVAIIIVPKELQKYAQISIVSNLKRIAKKTAFMQEGPSWYYQDLPLNFSFLHFYIMESVDFVLAHNECDRKYYEGLLEKPSFINPTLMIEESIGELETVERKNIILGGNFGRWYGGFDSYVVSGMLDGEVYAPSMGRMKSEEINIDGITHLPYLAWKQWIHTLNKFKYAIHMIPNTIGGTFSLNCAYLGIPCIGNIKSNTQHLCYPYTSVDVMDIGCAKKIAKQLKDDDYFYHEVSMAAKDNYKDNFSLDIYKSKLSEILNKI